MKGLDRLRPEQRATAKLLAHWREETAIKHDKPRGWILADDALREIAERMPGKAADLENIRTVPAGVRADAARNCSRWSRAVAN